MPSAHRDSAAAPAHAPSSSRGSGLVLVVDDTASVRDVLLRYLDGSEFQGVAAASGADAVRVIKESHPQLVVLDWVLPGGIDGLAVLKAIKSGAATKHIPVIMVSSIRCTREDDAAARQAGAALVLQKWRLTDDRSAFLDLLRDTLGKSKPSRTWRLLVIEDDVEVQELIRFSLARREFELHFSGTGRDGFRTAQAQVPDLIVLDLGLPDMNGVEVYKLIRSNPGTKAVPVLVMSGMDRTAGVLQGALMELGVDDFIPKPFGENELLGHISKTLERGRARALQREVFEQGRVRVDARSRSVWVGGCLLSQPLGHKQFELLCVLMQDVNGHSAQDLLLKVWSSAENPKVVGVTVSRLRQALGFGPTEGIIAVPHGYKFVG